MTPTQALIVSLEAIGPPTKGMTAEHYASRILANLPQGWSFTDDRLVHLRFDTWYGEAEITGLSGEILEKVTNIVKGQG